MKQFAILALALLIALPASAAGVTISGYIDFGYISMQHGSQTTADYASPLQAAGSTNGNFNQNDGFALNEVNLDLSSQLTNDISAFASIDFGALTTVELGAIDYAYIDFANPGPFDLNVRAGRIPSVVGIEQRVSESNQNKFINLSLVSPYTVGAVDGVAIYGSFSPVNYAVSLSNSDIIGGQQAGANNIARIRRPGNDNFTATGATNDNNNDKAVMARIGVVPIEGLEVGVSGGLDQWQTGGTLSTPANLKRTTFAGDLSYVWGALTLKAEYASIKEEQNQVALVQGDVKTTAYYVEGMYDLNSKWSFGARYNNVGQSQSGVVAAAGTSDKINSLYTVSAAGLYRVADNVLIKGEYDYNRERTLNRRNTQVDDKITTANDVFALSLVGSF